MQFALTETESAQWEKWGQGLEGKGQRKGVQQLIQRVKVLGKHVGLPHRAKYPLDTCKAASRLVFFSIQSHLDPKQADS